MLATVPQDTIPLREHSHLDFQHSNPTDPLALEDRLCPGCKNSVVNEQGGLVVAFGQSFFHVDCFKCAKCRNQVTADTNLLLLSDGSPICANCSYSCNICHLPILDEAIMTGDDSYHAHCFKCKVCSNRIDELVFAKTSQGIYCMNCHNERMIKIRKHAQKKAERERANGGSGSSRSREHDARNFHRDIDKPTSGNQVRKGSVKPPQALQSSRSESLISSETLRSPTKPAQGSVVGDRSEPSPPYRRGQPSGHLESPSVTTVLPSQLEHNEDRSSSSPLPSFDLSLQTQAPTKSNTLPIHSRTKSIDSRRSSSYDDGFRPPDVSVKSSAPNDVGLDSPKGFSLNEGLTVTSRRDKRRSINPGSSLTLFLDTYSNPMSDGSLSPLEQTNSTFPYVAQPRKATFPPNLSSRPHSSSSSVQSITSSDRNSRMGQHQSQSSTLISHDQDIDDTIVMRSPPQMTVQLENLESPNIILNGNGNANELSNTAISLLPRSTAVTLSPTEHIFHTQRRVSSDSSRSLDTPNSESPSRAGSPAYRADVPRSVESGTDTDPENEADDSHFNLHEHSPPIPPPKDTNDNDADPSESYLSGYMSDEMAESLAVEQTSHTTYIAPALPPIRFSMNAGDFSELLSSVGGTPSLKSLDNLAKRTQQSQINSQATMLPIEIPTSPPNASVNMIVNSSTVTKIPEQGLGLLEETELGEDEPQFSSNSHCSGTTNSTIHVEGATTMSSNSEQTVKRRTTELDLLRLRDTLNNAKEKGARHLKVDIGFVDSIVDLLETRNAEYNQLKSKVDGINRESKLIIDGLTVAQAEYDRELKARRDAEAEVTRLRVLLSGQAARLTALSGDHRRQEVRQKLSRELHESLSGLEQDLSRLKVERDVTLAEVEELSINRQVHRSFGSPTDVPTNLGRSLTKRLEGIRIQYQQELVPLSKQRDILTREIAELKAVRDVFLEETTVLNARNEELAQLSAVYTRRIDNAPETPLKGVSQVTIDPPRPQPQPHLLAPSVGSSTSGSLTIYDENSEIRTVKLHKSENELHTPAKPKFKWPGTKAKDISSPSNMETTKSKAHIEHNFQQLSILRFTRCDHCGDKMWGSQLRCTVCSISIHVRCIANVQIPCSQHHNTMVDERIPLLPSMFGRDLTEQVLAEAKNGERQVPLIVEKCIEAVEARAMDYEGIYRKTGGSSQTKAITQLFDRGDYASFNLCDPDRFNDICSITSVLKTYFRSLPVPLLSFDLHDQFTAAMDIRDTSKQQSLIDLVHRLPDEHFFTLRMLMLHLNRVFGHCEKNLMTARNLGVVFGPTLMRSRDPAAEFSDMAGKALFIEWLIENAPQVFDTNE